MSTHRGLLFGDANAVRGDSHGHDAQRTVEVIGNAIADLAHGLVAGQNTRPVDDRFVAPALEGVEVLADSRLSFGVAARRGQGLDQFELGKNQVEDLRSLHLKRTLAEEMSKRVRCLVSGHLEDTLVNGKHDDAPGVLAAVTDFE